jgi:hypothetical protein
VIGGSAVGPKLGLPSSSSSSGVAVAVVGVNGLENEVDTSGQEGQRDVRSPACVCMRGKGAKRESSTFVCGTCSEKRGD